jgi:hypothetical protein
MFSDYVVRALVTEHVDRLRAAADAGRLARVAMAVRAACAEPRVRPARRLSAARQAQPHAC